MDPDDQQSKKITLANFFESIKDTNVVAQQALKLSSGLGKAVKNTSEFVEVNKKDIQELQKKVTTISKDITNIQDYIEDQQERRSRELDKREDEIFEKEDKLQKESKGDEGPLGKAKNFLDNRVEGGASAIATAGAPIALMGLNALADGIGNRNFTEVLAGIQDKITGNLFDLDRRNPNERNPLLGGLDLLSFDILDLDKKGRIIPGVKQFMKFYEGTDIGKKEAAGLKVVDRFFDTLVQGYLDKNVNQTALFGPAGLLADIISRNTYDKKFYDKKFFGGEIMGPTGIDQVPILATSGETIISKKDTEEIKEKGFSIDDMLKFIRNMLGIDKEKKEEEKKKNDNPYKVKDTNSKDFSILAAVSALETSDPQGQADVAQAIYNRLGDVVADIEGVDGRATDAIYDYTKESFETVKPGVFPEPTISDIVLKDAQYQPTFKNPNDSVGPGTEVADIWKNITDNETAIDAMVYYYKMKKDPRPDEKIRIDATRNFYIAVKSLQNKKLVESAQEFVGGRTEFRGGKPSDEYMVSGTGVDRGKIRGSSKDQHNMFFIGKEKQFDGSFETLGTDQQLIRGFQFSPLLESKSSNTSDLQSVVPSLEDSNQDYSVSLAQRDDGDMTSEIEIREAIIQSTNDKGDGTGSVGVPPFQVADTGTPIILPTLCPFESAAIKRDTSNNAFV